MVHAAAQWAGKRALTLLAVDLAAHPDYCTAHSLFPGAPYLQATMHGKPVLFRRNTQKSAVPQRTGPIVLDTIATIAAQVDAHIASGDPGPALVSYD